MTNFPLETWDAALDCDHAEPRWLWHGLLAPGKTTLFTSLWKSGKTTLVSLLLSRRRAGGQLLGLNVTPGKSVVVSEGPELWAMRRRKLDLGETCFFCRPFPTRPTLHEMRDLAARILEIKAEHGVDLAVFDTLSVFLPTPDENNATLVMQALEPFRTLCERGLAVLLLHHPRKDDAGLGRAARGSGALTAAVDIFLEMRHPGGNVFSRRRRLAAFGRFEETPRQLLIELNPAGTDYAVLTQADDDDDFFANWELVRLVLATAAAPLTRQQILHAWPPEFARPSPANLWKWLSRATDLGLLTRAGAGTKAEAFRYGLAEAKDDEEAA